MHLKLVLLLGVSLLSQQGSAVKPGCLREGECLLNLDLADEDAETYGTPDFSFDTLEIMPLSSVDECLALCSETENCANFTFYQDRKICYLFDGCTHLSTTGCFDCISGSLEGCRECEEPGKVKHASNLANTESHSHHRQMCWPLPGQ